MTTTSDDMIERVARAIADKMHAGGDFGMTGADAYRRRSAEFMSLARAAIEAMQPSILAERERYVAEIAALREQLAESDRSAERPYSILEPKGGWRSKEQFSEVERRKLLPIAETLALLDGNAFFTVGAENEWAFSYLPEADAIYQANGGDNGWAGEASFAKPFAAAIRKGSD